MQVNGKQLLAKPFLDYIPLLVLSSVNESLFLFRLFLELYFDLVDFTGV